MKNRRLILLPCLALLAMSISSCASSSSREVPGPGSDSGRPSHNDNENETAVNGVTLNYEELTMYKGKSASLKATVTPDTALNKEVTWTSSNESVATVNNGLVSATSEGTTVITVKTSEGGYTATCAITVITEEEETPYNPDTTDSDIYFITDSTLSNGSYDSAADEYTFSITKNITR